MSTEHPIYAIGELADLAGVSRRTVRYYVQRRLLPPPLGVGRGQHYGELHLERLRRLRQLQRQGWELEALAAWLELHGELPAADGPPPLPAAPALARSGVADPWLRLPLFEGAELLVRSELVRGDPVDQLRRLSEAVRHILARPAQADPATDTAGSSPQEEKR